jgi:hypothetical protein
MKEGVHFSAKGVAKMHGCQAAEKKKTGKSFFKSWMPGTVKVGNFDLGR